MYHRATRHSVGRFCDYEHMRWSARFFLESYLHSFVLNAYASLQCWTCMLLTFLFFSATFLNVQNLVLNTIEHLNWEKSFLLFMATSVRFGGVCVRDSAHGTFRSGDSFCAIVLSAKSIPQITRTSIDCRVHVVSANARRSLLIECWAHLESPNPRIPEAKSRTKILSAGACDNWILCVCRTLLGYI